MGLFSNIISRNVNPDRTNLYINGNGKYQNIQDAIQYGAIKLTMTDFKTYTEKGMRYYRFYNDNGYCHAKLKTAVRNKYGKDSKKFIARYLEEDFDEFFEVIKNKML